MTDARPRTWLDCTGCVCRLIQLKTLPAVHVVIISHDYYDHLDIDPVVGFARTHWVLFLCLLVSGVHLSAWGIPGHRIVELDWDQSTPVDELTLICAPARYFSGVLPAPKHHAVGVVGVARFKSSRIFWW